MAKSKGNSKAKSNKKSKNKNVKESSKSKKTNKNRQNTNDKKQYNAKIYKENTEYQSNNKEQHKSRYAKSNNYKNRDYQKNDGRYGRLEEKLSKHKAKNNAKESELERKTNSSKKAKLAKALAKHGYSEKYLSELSESQLYRILSRNPHLRSLYYLFVGFIDVGEKAKTEDKIKEINEMTGTPVIFLSGALGYPYSVEQIKKYTNMDIVHVGTRDLKELHKIIAHAFYKTGQKPVIYAYSDGGKTISKYISKYGDTYLSTIYGVGANKNIPSDKAVYINGKSDAIAPIEKGYYRKTDKPIYTVEGGHVDLVYNPDTIKQIEQIINTTAKIGKYNYEMPNPLTKSTLEQKVVNF